MKKLLFSFVFFIFGLSVNASDWELYEEEGFFIDKSSIVRTEESTKAWVLIVANGKINNKKYAYAKNYVDVKCAENKIANLEINLFNKKHELVASVDNERINNITYDRYIPDSRGESIFKVICSY